MSHLLVAISGHGYGHLAQVAPVVNALSEQSPGVRLTVRTSLPRHLLQSRIHAPFELQAQADDFGLVQTSALDVDLDASARAYKRFHGDWEARVEAAARELQTMRPDLILADVPYLILAAGARAGIPSVALCSLNWADIYQHFFGSDRIYAHILAAYRAAEVFLRPEPSMPMGALEHARAIGPVIEAGHARRAELAQRLQLEQDERLVLVSLGGIRARLPIERWPRMPGVRWLLPAACAGGHPDAVAWEQSRMPFSDVLASVDLLVTKPGYGSFVEAAACGLPVAYIPRTDWPEQPFLARWLERRGHADVLTRTAVESGDMVGVVGELLAKGPYRPVAATGVQEALNVLLGYMAA